MASRTAGYRRARLAHAFLLGTAAGCAASVPVPPPLAPLDGVRLDRFDRVEAGVYRSAQPTATQLAELKRRYGIRSVLKLNRGRDDAPPGVQVIHMPLDVIREPTPAELARVLDALERAPRPVLVHCTHGEDRTGLIVALYRLRHGAGVAEVYTDMVRHRFHPYPGVWRAWLRAAGWDGARRQAAAPPAGAATAAGAPGPG